METVIVMPVLLLLIFGVIQFAHIWTARQMVAYAAFCATRAIMVVPDKDNEKDIAAQKAAEIALSWMNISDDKVIEGRSDKFSNCVSIPGWGRVGGSGFSTGGFLHPQVDPKKYKRVLAEILPGCTGEEKDGDGNDIEVAAVRVRFLFPLIIPGMAVNKIIGNASRGAGALMHGSDFYGNLHDAALNPILIDGWPYIELKETCVLPMPYSTVNFPKGAFKNVDIRRGS